MTMRRQGFAAVLGVVGCLIIYSAAAHAQVNITTNDGQIETRVEIEGADTARRMVDKPFAVLRALDKVTARTTTFEVAVGQAGVQFGRIAIRVQACRKSDPFSKPEAAAFVQTWEDDKDGAPQWIFSGWMFASSPALSAMDHPVYDVWVLDCVDDNAAKSSASSPSISDAAAEGSSSR